MKAGAPVLAALLGFLALACSRNDAAGPLLGSSLRFKVVETPEFCSPPLLDDSWVLTADYYLASNEQGHAVWTNVLAVNRLGFQFGCGDVQLMVFPPGSDCPSVVHRIPVVDMDPSNCYFDAFALPVPEVGSRLVLVLTFRRPPAELPPCEGGPCLDWDYEVLALGETRQLVLD